MLEKTCLFRANPARMPGAIYRCDDAVALHAVTAGICHHAVEQFTRRSGSQAITGRQKKQYSGFCENHETLGMLVVGIKALATALALELKRDQLPGPHKRVRCTHGLHDYPFLKIFFGNQLEA